MIGDKNANRMQGGGTYYRDFTKKEAQAGLAVKKITPMPKKETNWLQNIERNVNEYLDYPQKTAVNIGESAASPGDDPVDNIRHSVAGMKTTQALMNKGLPAQYAVLAAGAMGTGHEIAGIFKDKRDWSTKLRESAEDIYNNTVGSGMALTSGTNREKINRLKELSFQNKLPDGYAGLPEGQDMYFKQKGGGVKYNTPEYNKAYGEGTVMRYDQESDVFAAPNLPEFSITEDDPRVLNAIYGEQNSFLKRVLESLSQPQKQAMEWITGKQQFPSEAWGYEKPEGFWQNAANFGMDAVLDPTNLIGAGAASKALKLGNIAKKRAKNLSDI